MKHLPLPLAGLTLALAALLYPAAASAQSSPSPYTSATRYDAAGRATGTISPDPDTVGSGNPFLATRTSYDSRGNVVKVESGTLASWQSEAVAPASWSGFTVYTTQETTYDLLDRKLTETLKGSDLVAVSLTQFSYDMVGRLMCTAVRMNPATYSSLPASACEVGAEGSHGPDRITKNIYDAAGQLIQVREAVDTSIESSEATFSYTANGKREYIVDANGNRARLTYDAHDRQNRWEFPSTTRSSSFDDSTPAKALMTAGQVNTSDYEAYGYDANGNRTSLRKRDGLTIGYTYDNLNRVTVKTVPERTGLATIHTRDVYYSYDLQGRQTSARFGSTTGQGSISTWDGFGRLTSVLDSIDAKNRTVSYQHDGNGSRTRITYPDAMYFDYAYDGIGRLSKIESMSVTTYVEPSYNARGLVIAPTRASTPADQALSYDAAGRMSGLSIHNAQTGIGVSWSFTRNAASQILTQTRDNDSYAWGDHYNLDRNYTANGLNQYTAAGGAGFCYDANGNLIADGKSVYLYDVENRLVEMRAHTLSNCGALSYSGALQAELRYDTLGRLYYLRDHVGSNGITRFLYDGDAMVAEYNDGTTMLRRYVHGPDGGADDPLIWYEGDTIRFVDAQHLYPDPRGSIVLVGDVSGAAVAINTFDEYGIPGAGNVGRFQYTGQAWMPELGMYYYKARMYSPTLGRFMQTDPLGYEDQFNLYAYVKNDSINRTDFSGMEDDEPDSEAEEAADDIVVYGTQLHTILARAGFRIVQGTWDASGRTGAHIAASLAWALYGQFIEQAPPKFGSSSGVTGQLLNMLSKGNHAANAAGTTGEVRMSGGTSAAQDDWKKLVSAAGARERVEDTPLGPVTKIDLPGGGTASIRNFGKTHDGISIQVSKRFDMPQRNMKFRY